MLNSIKRVLIGKPLKNESIHEQKYSVFLGLPILASDAISSVAYASEEILIVLIPAVGILAYRELSFISLTIITLLLILTFSYQQTLKTYPNGGGAYIVASDNLGHIAGVTAGAALSVDYILTVAVSISSGTAAITSAFPPLYPFRVLICLAILLLIMLGNLRGIRDASKLFSIPTYAFIGTMIIMIICGIIGHFTGTIHAVQPATQLLKTDGTVTTVLMLTAFANGCSALTGVEAVSNAIPNFKEPQVKNARYVLLLLSFFVLLLFGGISLLANFYHVAPVEGKTVLSQIAASIFGYGPMFYVVQATTAVILVLAANTSYSDFPLLSSLIARDGYSPRQLSLRGDRLSFSNGIIALSVVAAILIIVFRGDTNSLIPLYAVGVFISFTLSQFGMFKRWVTRREGHWIHKALINGLGAAVTAVVVCIIAVTKFSHGAWIVVVVIPLLVIGMLKIKAHYMAVADELRIEPCELEKVGIENAPYRNRVIVPIESINRASVRALRYAETISDHTVAFNISINEEDGLKVRERYEKLNTNVPLHIHYSPYRKVFEPLLQFIESEEYDYKKGDMVTVIIPQFEVKRWWQRVLHNGSGKYLTKQLCKYKHIVVATMPLQLNDEGLLFTKR
jgi:amino acid transporter